MPRPLSLLFSFLLLFTACSTEQAESFPDWYRQQKGEAFEPTKNPEAPLHTDTFRSRPLGLDTIYRSMEGPYEERTIQVGEEGEGLIWLIGYSARILDAESGEQLPDGYMCHNNLNLGKKASLPWKVRTKGSKTRLFTLTEGQVEMDLPQGFGIPLPAGTELKLASQVLNHNDPTIDQKVRHEVQVQYRRDEELEKPLLPLYQQPAFVTRKTGGPKGRYGRPLEMSSKSAEEKKVEADTDTAHGRPGCAITVDSVAYNPYKDAYGRSFTGHWDLPDTAQTLRREVTPMLDLSFDTKAHYVGVHVHPFARSLALRDMTADTVLFKADVRNRKQRIGIRHIQHYKSRKGIPLKKDHRYELISRYAAPDTSGRHTAMASMFLYLRDEKS